VFDELLDDRSGPLDHLAGGDLIGQILGQLRDAAHQSHPDFLNHQYNSPHETAMRTITSQNGPVPGSPRLGSGTFMPNSPVMTVRGPNSVAITASSRDTSARRFETLARWASRMPVTRSWNTIASSAMRANWS